MLQAGGEDQRLMSTRYQPGLGVGVGGGAGGGFEVNMQVRLVGEPRGFQIYTSKQH